MADVVQFRLVDAFAAKPYTGNVAGVVLDADVLDEKQMQLIAREINASETAFIARTNDLHRPPTLRWFTPAVEVGFCGHATLAATHAMAEAGCVKHDEASNTPCIEFETAVGILRLHGEPIGGDAATPLWWLHMPSADLTPDRGNPKRLCDDLGLTLDDLEPAIPIMRTRDGDVILLIKSWRRLHEMRPDFARLLELSQKQRIRGFCVSTLNTLSPATTVHSRFFAPAAGVNEDPVTGSVHGPLATLLIANELVPVASGRAALNCLQGQPGGRTGLVRVLAESTGGEWQVAIAGQCHTTLQGELCIPPRE